jgi:hypothetical protein
MERTVNLVFRGTFGSGEILSKMGKNKAGEPAIIFYSQQRPSGWFDQLKMDAKKLFRIVRSGTEVAKEYSKELNLAAQKSIMNTARKVEFSAGTPLGLQHYLNNIKAGSFEDTDKGVKTKVNVELESTHTRDGMSGNTPWNDNDRKIFESLKSPNQTLEYHSHTSSPQLRDSSASSGTESDKDSKSQSKFDA